MLKGKTETHMDQWWIGPYSLEPV
jgi:hypothetical protein